LTPRETLANGQRLIFTGEFLGALLPVRSEAMAILNAITTNRKTHRRYKCEFRKEQA
jgi:hypothetical protein